MLKQTTVYNVSLHLHAKFQKRHLKVVLYLPSAPRLQHVLFCATNECCPLVSRTLPVSLSLSQTCSGWWVSFSAQFRKHEIVTILIFSVFFLFMQRSSGFTFLVTVSLRVAHCRADSRSVTIGDCRVDSRLVTMSHSL